jgi:hypothetical protein
LNFLEILVRPVVRIEEDRYQELMHEHHYLGRLPKISETLWYLALWHNQWVALLGFSAAAWKCAARDRWIGWSSRHQYDRLKLVANNSRFLILPDWHVPNLGSRILSLCQKRWFRKKVTACNTLKIFNISEFCSCITNGFMLVLFCHLK